MLRRFEWLVEKAVVIVFVLMIVISFAQVFCRYALNNPLFGSEELARLFAVWLTFLGAAVAIKHGGHIAVDILSTRVPVRVQKIFELVTGVLLLVFCLILLLAGVEHAYNSHRFESSALRFPMSLVFSALPVSALISILFIVRSGYRTLKDLKGPNK
jgi:TRAP-type C4-dicarboxylate transport system permease small subunit